MLWLPSYSVSLLPVLRPEDGKAVADEAMTPESQQVAVAGDQRTDTGCQRDLEELLVVAVTARWELLVQRAGREAMSESLPICVEQDLLRLRRLCELTVGQHPSQFLERILARKQSAGPAGKALAHRFQHRVAGDLVDDGAGVGDLIAGVTVDPLEERLGPHGGGLPVPVVTLSLRAPTGRDWTDSDGPLLADTTGVEGFGGRAAVQVERTMGTPWWLGTDLALDPHLPARIGVAGGVGRYLGTDWTLSGTLRHERQLTADGTARTLVGARVIRGQRLAWRAWVGAGTDVGLSGLGADLPVLASADLGLAWIH